MYTYTNKRRTPDRVSPAQQDAVPSRSELLHQAGAGAPQPMSPQLREKFEPGFAADFSNIRISRGRIPEALGVQAAAQGTDILLDQRAGMDVLGHELAHVVQQAQGRVGKGFPVVENAALEREADAMGQRAASGFAARVGDRSGVGGETMVIAPMSAASAPAQCKGGKHKPKKKGGQPPVAQQTPPAPVPAPAPAGPAPEVLQATAAAAARSRGFVSSRVTAVPHALGPDTRMKVQHNEGGIPLPAAAMQAAKDAGGNQSEIFLAGGLRENGEDAAKAVRERTGTAFEGLSDDIKDWGGGLKRQGLSWTAIQSQAERDNTRSGRQGFYMSEDISNLSVGAMEIFDQYLNRPAVRQLLRDRYRMVTGTDVFGENQGNGTELDYIMTDLMNRDFGLDAFAKLRVELGKHDFDERMGSGALNSFLTRLPNLVRGVETGAVDPANVPAHALPAVDRYRQLRGRIGQMVDPDRYDPATGGRAAPVPPAPASEGEESDPVAEMMRRVAQGALNRTIPREQLDDVTDDSGAVDTARLAAAASAASPSYLGMRGMFNEERAAREVREPSYEGTREMFNEQRAAQEARLPDYEGVKRIFTEPKVPIPPAETAFEEMRGLFNPKLFGRREARAAAREAESQSFSGSMRSLFDEEAAMLMGGGMLRAPGLWDEETVTGLGLYEDGPESEGDFDFPGMQGVPKGQTKEISGSEEAWETIQLGRYIIPPEEDADAWVMPARKRRHRWPFRR